MRPLTLDEIVEETGGALVDGPQTIGASGDEVVTSVSTDTRTLEPGALFVALRGENHDGHAFLDAARQKGAGAFLVDHALHDPSLPHVVVADTLHAYGDIARYVRDFFTGPVVGVTGSVGKTTAKEMIALVLARGFSVHKSAANFNNEIGVPKTIFEMPDACGALVVEMGMRGLGQITHLCDIAAPTIGVVTNIGVSHLELLGSRARIADAKGELLAALPADTGLAIVPADDEFAAALRAKAHCPVLTCGIDTPDADIRATDLVRHENGWRFAVETPWGATKAFLPSPGRFNVLNALFAVAVGGHLGVPLASIARALLDFEAPSGRMEISTVADAVTLLYDAYNAAPDSMVGALETLRDLPNPTGRRIAVLGEMRELGDYTQTGHETVGIAVAKTNPDRLVVVGPLAETIARAAIAGGFSAASVVIFASTDAAVAGIDALVQPGDAVLIKGSRALALERVADALRGDAARD